MRTGLAIKSITEMYEEAHMVSHCRTRLKGDGKVNHVLDCTVERESQFVRPVLILGPFAQSIIEKLSSDHPSKFVQCTPEYMNSDLKTVEKVELMHQCLKGVHLSNLCLGRCR